MYDAYNLFYTISELYDLIPRMAIFLIAAPFACKIFFEAVLALAGMGFYREMTASILANITVFILGYFYVVRFLDTGFLYQGFNVLNDLQHALTSLPF
ncbi:hypothetical protein [Syntrophothermus lipocalidus]|uniref:Uncharacterized protein n=1 Tax=Syntrophothermus lipocalidus (strain DSM 12680 / TGB-C1) TaxID=643648 RepID=D7CPZ7_SYNLT|nr:hypothetical protein [Syntrophothermus lipocalidus]ADI02775.1 hypothetical protein Slip_2028 [Syntrophothermus lipocalidus DSM 12680]